MGGVHDMKAIIREEAPDIDLRDITMHYDKDFDGSDVQVFTVTTREGGEDVKAIWPERSDSGNDIADIAREIGRRHRTLLPFPAKGEPPITLPNALLSSSEVEEPVPFGSAPKTNKETST